MTNDPINPENFRRGPFHLNDRIVARKSAVLTVIQFMGYLAPTQTVWVGLRTSHQVALYVYSQKPIQG